jgi:hypothetical protein
MIDKRRRPMWFRSISLASLALGAAGCADELGPVSMAVAPVKGVVTNGRIPVRNGWIEFIPIDGTVGNPYSARIREDGSFEAARVAVGMNLIRMAHVSLGSNVAERVFGAYHSPIHRVIAPQSTEPLVINLIDESVRHRMRPPASAGDAQ